MATTQLAIYNRALVEHLGERELASLAENREPRRVLDSVWGDLTSGVVKQCLEQGDWKFAQRVTRLDYSGSITPTFGYRRAFEKPTDFVRISLLCTDEWFKTPLTQYTEETGLWFSDYEQLFLSYVSNDASYGGDMTLWPESFVSYVAGELALRACNRLKNNKTDKELLKKDVDDLLKEARSRDAMQGPTKFLPPGSWAKARGSAGVYDKGSKVSLYG